MEQKQDEPGTIEQIRAIWKDWQINPDKLQASQAMVKIGEILEEAAAREQRLKTILEDAKRDQVLKELSILRGFAIAADAKRPKDRIVR